MKVINNNRRKRIFEIIQIGCKTDFASRAFDFTVVILVLISVIISVCYTFDELAAYYNIFHVIEAITVFFFVIELVLRVWTADLLFEKGKVAAAIRYLVSFNGMVELWSIIPFFLPLLFPKGIIVFRIFRVVRILRLFQVNQHTDAMSMIIKVVKRKRNQLLSSMLIIFIIMLMSSLVMYGFEHEAQPDIFENAFSGIWWATSTLLTVGYGDIYPVTIMGKVVSIFITFLGVGMVAIPTGILSAGFTEYISEQRKAQLKEKTMRYCPQCGEKL